MSELCGVKPHVLRYWEQEFTQLKPVKRRGNRRYYQHHEVLLIRRIRELLYDQGFTISGARNRLDELVSEPAKPARAARAEPRVAAQGIEERPRVPPELGLRPALAASNPHESTGISGCASRHGRFPNEPCLSSQCPQRLPGRRRRRRAVPHRLGGQALSRRVGRRGGLLRGPRPSRGDRGDPRAGGQARVRAHLVLHERAGRSSSPTG